MFRVGRPAMEPKVTTKIGANGATGASREQDYVYRWTGPGTLLGGMDTTWTTTVGTTRVVWFGQLYLSVISPRFDVLCAILAWFSVGVPSFIGACGFFPFCDQFGGGFGRCDMFGLGVSLLLLRG